MGLQRTSSYVFWCILHSSSLHFLRLRPVVSCWYAVRASIRDRPVTVVFPSVYPYAALCRPFLLWQTSIAHFASVGCRATIARPVARHTGRGRRKRRENVLTSCRRISNLVV